MHYGVYCDVEFIKYMVETIGVPYDFLNEEEENILYGSGGWDHDKISENTLDYLIDDLGLDYKGGNKWKTNILMDYIQYGRILKLGRIIYWIEKRAIDPWDTNWGGTTIFVLLEERIKKNKPVDEEVRLYLSAIKDKKS